MKKLINKLQKENSIGEDVKILKDFFSDRFEVEQEVQAVEHILKELKRFENMYEAEHQIHMVRNEQLARKQQLVIKCNELENENKELKKENEEKTTIILAGAEKVKQLENMGLKKYDYENPSVRIDILIEKIRKNSIGKSLTFPEGWISPQKVVEIIKSIIRK